MDGAQDSAQREKGLQQQLHSLREELEAARGRAATAEREETSIELKLSEADRRTATQVSVLASAAADTLQTLRQLGLPMAGPEGEDLPRYAMLFSGMATQLQSLDLVLRKRHQADAMDVTQSVCNGLLTRVHAQSPDFPLDQLLAPFASSEEQAASEEAVRDPMARALETLQLG